MSYMGIGPFDLLKNPYCPLVFVKPAIFYPLQRRGECIRGDTSSIFQLYDE